MRSGLMRFSDNESIDMAAAGRALAHILSHCQFCGQRIVVPKGVDEHTAKFGRHKCLWDRRGG